MILRPRSTLAALVQQPHCLDTWILILVVVAACGAGLLATEVGQQALVDERVRVIETFGGRVNDAEYAALLAKPPRWVYLASGGRLLLMPVVTVLVAAVCWLVARADGAPATFKQALAVVVHASIVLAIGQVVATPLNYIRESLTSPLNLAAVLPLMEAGTTPARFFGAMDVFALWWMALIAIGLAALTRRRVRRYAGSLAAVYVGFAAIMAAVIAAVGGA